MTAERPEKRAVRDLWIDVVSDADRAHADPAAPLYTTLPGADGRDIELLAQRGVIARTDTGAIADDDLWKVVAIESGHDAILQLQGKFPGLKIMEESVENILRSTSPTRWPTGEHERACRARVINLDLNGALDCQVARNQLCFPVVDVVTKIATIHGVAAEAGDEPASWTLLLTLNATINWSREVMARVQRFLIANFRREAAFAEATKRVVGDDLFSRIESNDPTQLETLDAAAGQALLMTVAPKAIANRVHTLGWRVETARNLRYGGTYRTAPMVTWVLDFFWDERATLEADVLYRDCLRDIHTHSGVINREGLVAAA